jgi:hypothetical protein
MARDEVTVRVPKALLVVVLVLLVGCAVGALGFFLGRDSAPEETTVATTPAKDDGARQDSGSEGEGDESASPTAEAGAVDGAARTYAQGLRDGREEGREAGLQAGAEQALALDQFDFDPATFYVIQFAEADGGAGLEISGADQMLPGSSYLLCNTNDLCTQ